MAKEGNSEQELTQKFMMFEQQIRLLQEQIQSVEQAVFNLTDINLGLGDLKGKKDSEILAPIGRGIFVKAKLLSEELMVDVGEKVLVKKSIPETQLILTEQINKLDQMKTELNNEMEKVSDEITNIFLEHQKKVK